MIVVKLGGEMLLPEQAETLRPILNSIRALHEAGEQVVVVHGGGPQTSSLMKERGLEPRMVAGQRVTDASALQCLLMAVAGEANARLVAALVGNGLTAVGLNGISAGCIQCVRRSPRPVASAGGALVDYGLVGDVQRVDRAFIELFVERAMVPVIACVGTDREGGILNVNGDTVASELARAMRAETLALVTGTPGVLRDVADPSSRIQRLGRAELEGAIADGTIAGGMIAKVEEATRALDGGVSRVLVLGRLGEGELERAIRAPGCSGTVLEA